MRTKITFATTLMIVVSCIWVMRAADRSPIADAAERGDLAAVRALIKQAVDVSAARADGMTALHIAAQRNDAELATLLLTAGANVRATTRLGGYTPLHLASKAGATAVIKALAGAGADVNARTTTGATPLMFASALDRADAVRALVQHGADKTLASKTVDVSRVSPPEEVLQQQIREQQNAKSAAAAAPGGAAPPPARPANSNAAPTVGGVSRPYTFNELIGQQGGLTALHFAARQGAMHTAQTLV